MQLTNLGFEALVTQHYESLYRFAFSLARNEPDACDLTQQTFYIWATKSHQLRDRSKTKTWLFTTLYRSYLQSRRRETHFPHEPLDDSESQLPSVEPVMADHLDWEQVIVALGQVDEKFKAAVALFYLDDYSYKEIAEVLDLPIGTVKSRLARGLGQMKSLLIQKGASVGKAHT